MQTPPGTGSPTGRAKGAIQTALHSLPPSHPSCLSLSLPPSLTHSMPTPAHALEQVTAMKTCTWIDIQDECHAKVTNPLARQAFRKAAESVRFTALMSWVCAQRFTSDALMLHVSHLSLCRPCSAAASSRFLSETGAPLSARSTPPRNFRPSFSTQK
jgi:hypothetical protein